MKNECSCMKTKNQYYYPVKISKEVRIVYKESPAHTGKLKNAVDFITAEGTPIRASLNGVVVDIKQNSDIGGPDKSFDNQGNYIEIQHRNKEYTIYEHIKKNGSLVKVGDKVRTNQIIGYSGSTGWIAHLGSHLHFSVHKYTAKREINTLEIRWKIS